MVRRDRGELLDRFKTLSVSKECIGSGDRVIGLLVGGAPRAFRFFAPRGGLEAVVLASERGETLLDLRVLRRARSELLNRFKTLTGRKKCIGSRDRVIGLLVGGALRAFRFFGTCSGLEALVLAP